MNCQTCSFRLGALYILTTPIPQIEADFAGDLFYFTVNGVKLDVKIDISGLIGPLNIGISSVEKNAQIKIDYLGKMLPKFEFDQQKAQTVSLLD